MSPTNPDDARYTLTELADLAGVTPRTVRYYLGQGLLPAVGVSGPGAKYDDSHLARLRLIRRLQREHQPLAEIRRQLGSLDDAAVLAIAGEPTAPPPSDSAHRLHPPRHCPDPGGSRAVASAVPAVARRSTCQPPPRRRPRPYDLAPEPMPRIERSQWERISLGPDVELHLRRPLPRSTAKRVDRLVEIARDLLEEDLP